MSYEEWATTVPATLRSDPLWRREDYRLALYIADLGWDDVRKLVRVRTTDAMSDHLCRSLGSIGANIADGYSRTSGPHRVRCYEYALDSAREARDWYHKARHVLGPSTARHRLRVLTTIIRLLTHAIPLERGTGARPITSLAQGGVSPHAGGASVARTTGSTQPARDHRGAWTT